MIRDLGYIDALVGELKPELTEHQLGLLATKNTPPCMPSSATCMRTRSIRCQTASSPSHSPGCVYGAREDEYGGGVRGQGAFKHRWGASPASSTRPSMPSTNPRGSFQRSSVTMHATDAIPTACSQTRYTARGKTSPGARTGTSASQAPGSADRRRTIRPHAGRRQTEKRDAAERNVVEEVFGTAPMVYGLDPVRARLEETTKTVIGLAILVFNLKKLLTVSLSLFLGALIFC